MPEPQLIACVDFDGTIVERKFPAIGNLMPMAKEGMLFLKEKGFTIVVWSCREGSYVVDAVNFLHQQGIPFDYFNDNTPGIKEIFKSGPPRKVFGTIYLDDQNWPPFPGWPFFMRYFDNLGLPTEFDYKTYCSLYTIESTEEPGFPSILSI